MGIISRFASLFLATLFTISTFTEAYSATIKGRVADTETLEGVPGAQVLVVGTGLGAFTDEEGNYTIENVKAGEYTIEASSIGYRKQKEQLSIPIDADFSKTYFVNLFLGIDAIQSKAIEVVASRAKFRETPIAYSEISKEEMDLKGTIRDAPLVLNEKPGVYATEDGGSPGDARINIRGFDQSNIAVMINGVPINDMESGWVFWSNWIGINQITTSNQIQRGLGAGRIANPAVGGLLDYVTDAAGQKPKIAAGQRIGNGGFLQTDIEAHTGKVGDFAFSAALFNRSQDGVVEKTWADIWTYYGSVSWDINENHQVDAYLFGAYQDRGRRAFRSAAHVYDRDFAINELGVTPEQIDAAGVLPWDDQGILYNQNWGPIDSTVSIYQRGRSQGNPNNGFLMDRGNFYNKPQANINWYWQLNDKSSLTNVAYLSIASGGGYGTTGPQPYNYTAADSVGEDRIGQRNWNRVYQENSLSVDDFYTLGETRSRTALRNQINEHFWTGWLSTYDVQINKDLRFQGGIDYRYYEGQSYAEIRSLIGGDYFVETIFSQDRGSFRDSTADLNLALIADSLSIRIANERDMLRQFPDMDSARYNSLRSEYNDLIMKREGDKVSYWDESQIQWAGAFAQLEYSNNGLNTYLNTSFTNNFYRRIDYFRAPSSPNGNSTDWQHFTGYTVKTGANYNINKYFNSYINGGYYSRPPMYNVVFNNDNSFFANPQNEEVLSLELGTAYFDSKTQINLNTYYTRWENRPRSGTFWFIREGEFEGEEVSIEENYRFNLIGLGATHMGVELDGTYRPFRWMKAYGMLSFGNWVWNNDADLYLINQISNGIEDTVRTYTDGLKVGNAPQTRATVSLSFYPIKGLSAYVTYNYFADMWADYNPVLRNDPRDRAQAWKTPNYGVVNLGARYWFYIPDTDFSFTLRASVFNALDEVFITDADEVPNYRARNAQRDENGVLLHNAINADVFFGLPRRFSLGLEAQYRL
ncbi:MAG: TonB-dependent receptor [Candidatus Kapaibacteriales bacterium]